MSLGYAYPEVASDTKELIELGVRRFLELTRSAAEIAAMRSIKAALDPTWLLNPGAVLV